MNDLQTLFRIVPMFFLGIGLLGAAISMFFAMRRKREENRFKAIFVQRGFKERIEKGPFKKWVLFEKDGVGLSIYSQFRPTIKHTPPQLLLYKNLGEKFHSILIARKSDNFVMKNLVGGLVPLANTLFSLEQEKIVFKNPDHERNFTAVIDKSTQKAEWVENFMNRNAELFNVAAVRVYSFQNERLELQMSKGFFNEKNLPEADKIFNLLQNLNLPS